MEKTFFYYVKATIYFAEVSKRYVNRNETYSVEQDRKETDMDFFFGISKKLKEQVEKDFLKEERNKNLSKKDIGSIDIQIYKLN